MRRPTQSLASQLQALRNPATICEGTMLSHCANSQCLRPFLRLGQGKLFLVETECVAKSGGLRSPSSPRMRQSPVGLSVTGCARSAQRFGRWFTIEARELCLCRGRRPARGRHSLRNTARLLRTAPFGLIPLARRRGPGISCPWRRASAVRHVNSAAQCGRFLLL